ncbi:RNase P modulator RnpM [Senegalia massiliensis]|uniref:RNase P modulator RnpM n=1 Tax=Senegalia massiliensis TaxID=1720316 RepID=UPI001031520A|nr:YlxR family protein [Senegalia massiliensis]
MKNKKIPLRKCIICGERKEKKELIRIVKNKQGDIFIDDKGKANGRGAYICNNSECINRSFENKSLNKTFKSNISSEVYEELKKEINQHE